MNEQGIQVMERRAFRMDPALLWSVIKSQAGTLSKAMMEGVMNALDAGSTRCDITVDTLGYRIVDDGRGFSDRQTIVDFFETFGKPHVPGDAKVGRFRIGRGQLFSFSRTTWNSGRFKMVVDLQKTGLDYELHERQEAVPGCSIDGELYTPLKNSELIRLVDELRQMVEYSSMDVFINGELVSKNPATLKWTLEDEDGWYLVKDHAREMTVFNLGFLVRQYYGGEFGVCGVLVSKKQLEVNFARNDVLVASCPVTKRMAAKLRAIARTEAEAKPRNNEAAREMAMQNLLTGNFETGHEFMCAVSNNKVVTDYSGRHRSLMEFLWEAESSNRLICPANEYSMRADRVHQAKLALVVSPKTMARTKGLSFEQIVQRVASNLRAFDERMPRTVADRLVSILDRVKPLDVVGAMIAESAEVIDEKKLSKEERMVMVVLRKLNWMIASDVGCQERRLGVCVSEAMDGFTDGASSIHVNRKLLKMGGGSGQLLSAFEALKMLLIHEYLHDSADVTGHGHPPEFYERFHEVASNGKRLNRFGFDAVLAYLAMRRRDGAKLRAGDLKALDVFLIVDGDRQNQASMNDPASTPRQAA